MARQAIGRDFASCPPQEAATEMGGNLHGWRRPMATKKYTANNQPSRFESVSQI
jgi:hypothetical protein